MKFTATAIAATVAVVSAFVPNVHLVRDTSLAHALGGWQPGNLAPASSYAPAPAAPVLAAPANLGFSGFGHATGQMGGNPSIMQKYAPAPAPVAPVASAPAPVAPANLGFSGFGHATGQMGGNPSLMGASFIAPAPATATPSYSAPPASGLGFSGFGHAKGQMGGNPAITQGGHRSAPAPPTNFSRRTVAMAGSSSSYLHSL